MGALAKLMLFFFLSSSSSKIDLVFALIDYAAAESVYMNMLSESLKLNISADSLRSGMDNKCQDYNSLNKENRQKGISCSSFRMEGVLRKFRYM